jgi:hypothetical protein
MTRTNVYGGIRLRVYDSKKENILQRKKKLSLYIWVNITISASTFGPSPINPCTVKVRVQPGVLARLSRRVGFIRCQRKWKRLKFGTWRHKKTCVSSTKHGTLSAVNRASGISTYRRNGSASTDTGRMRKACCGEVRDEETDLLGVIRCVPHVAVVIDGSFCVWSASSV